MNVIEVSTEIARTPREVFEYVSDAARLPEWQPSVEEAAAEAPAIRQVGMRGHEVRRLPRGAQTIHWEVTECEPGSRWATRGIDGPVRAHVSIELDPGDGASTHVGYRVWFEGHGMGRLVKVLAQQGARREAPESLALLKRQLELARA